MRSLARTLLARTPTARKRAAARRRALALVVAAVALGVGVHAVTRPAPVVAQDEDEGRDSEEAKRVAKEELAKAVARGKELFESRSLGRKSCKDCHEDPDKPQDNLAEIAWSYPAYSRRARRVVTLQQKINEMIKYKARGKELDPAGGDIADLAAYVTSLRSR